jgi:hypothetical protein
VVRQEANDPFYQRDGARSLHQRLAPVKWEFVHRGTALASVNAHRDFFGERCSIGRQGSPEPAFTSCVGYGLERWISALVDRYRADWDRIFAVAENARTTVR